MKVNLGMPERVVRGVIGVLCAATGLSIGRHVWWGILLDTIGAVLLFSASTGFCHVRKVVGDLKHSSKS